MNQKGFVNIMLIILVVVLAGAAGYFVFSGKPVTTPIAQPSLNTIPTQTTHNIPANIPPSVKNNFSPTIDSISQSSGHEGDIITVHGSNFMRMVMVGSLKGEISTVQFLQNGKVIKSTRAINVSSDDKQLSFSYDPQHIIGSSRLPDGLYQLRISNHVGEKGVDTDYVVSNTIDFTALPSTTSGEATIMTYSGRFIANNVLVVPEYINGVPTGVEWTVNYKDAKYYEEWQDNGQTYSRLGNFDDWLKTRKQIWDSNYNGPGIPGVIKIVGIINASGTLVAYKIIQHVQ